MTSWFKYVPGILIMLLSAEMQAQIRTGNTIGVNLSTVKINSVETIYSPRLTTGINLGLILEIPFKKQFTFQPGFIFSSKGSTFKSDTAEYNISPVYIEVPLDIRYIFGSNKIRVSLFGGPYIAFVIGGYKIDEDGNVITLSYGKDENSDINPFDAGINFGATIHLSNILISARYGIGLINLSPLLIFDPEMNNRVIGISITSLFAGSN